MNGSNANTHDATAVDESGCDRTRDAEAERLDAVFDVLADARRRRILRVLIDADEDATTVPALAEALSAREPERPPTDRLVVSLRHVHLPKLDASGVVDYAPDRSRVRYEGAPLAERLLAQL
ncbi:DUF7344 domain-containing protein [Haloplanus halophilus]|uniref:DUF7344 domain-containing protein n=1 Tax=Haloplanus halophilus TaxID=2949993 RepID=UPI00203EA7A4|nr:hypothetical protein [Haloplanus sp. GDY1]